MEKAIEYLVTAQAVNRKTGKPEGDSRTELINVVNNRLFHGAKNIMDVKAKYESFWNDLNPKSREVVFVSNVQPK